MVNTDKFKLSNYTTSISEQAKLDARDAKIKAELEKKKDTNKKVLSEKNRNKNKLNDELNTLQLKSKKEVLKLKLRLKSIIDSMGKIPEDSKTYENLKHEKDSLSRQIIGKEDLTLEEEVNLRSEIGKVSKEVSDIEKALDKIDDSFNRSNLTKFLAEFKLAKGVGAKLGVMGKAMSRGIGRSDSYLAKGISTVGGLARGIGKLTSFGVKKATFNKVDLEKAASDVFGLENYSVFNRKREDEWSYGVDLLWKKIKNLKMPSSLEIADFLEDRGLFGKIASIPFYSNALNKAIKKANLSILDRAEKNRKVFGDKETKKPTKYDDDDDDEFDDYKVNAGAKVIDTIVDRFNSIENEIENKDSNLAIKDRSNLSSNDLVLYRSLDESNKDILKECLLDFYTYIEETRNDNIKKADAKKKAELKYSKKSGSGSLSTFSKVALATLIGVATAFIVKKAGDKIGEAIIDIIKSSKNWWDDLWKNDKNLINESSSDLTKETDNLINKLPKIDDSGNIILNQDSGVKAEDDLLNGNIDATNISNINNSTEEKYNISDIMKEFNVESKTSNLLSDINQYNSENQLISGDKLFLNNFDDESIENKVNNIFNKTMADNYSINSSQFKTNDIDIIEKVNKEIEAKNATLMKQSSTSKNPTITKYPAAIKLSSQLSGAGLDLLNH